MIDKWIYKFFAAIDDAFSRLDNIVFNILNKWRKIKMWKLIKKLWRKYTDWVWS
jgi:hypothetical protein